jgi:hypothetical protein
MAVAFRSAASAFDSSAASTSHPCSLPAGYTAGDLLIMAAQMWIFGGTAAAAPAPTGWTRQAQHNTTGSGYTVNYAVYTKVADGTEGTTVTLTTALSQWGCIGVLAYSGGTLDAFADFGSSQTSATPTIPSVTTTQANDIVVGLAICDTVFGSPDALPAAGWTERLERNNPNVNALVYGMDIAQAAAGASATATPTVQGGGINRTSFGLWTFAVAVKAAGGGGGSTFVPQTIVIS